MSENPSKLKTWAQLLRLPNLFTVPGDAVAGALLTGLAADIPKILAACASVLLLYMAGLLLNDFFDREEDAKERPNRPIPSGAAKAGVVLLVGLVLLGAGLAIATVVAGGLGLSAAGGLAVCIVAYDAGGRKIPFLGPVLMGACRGGSVIVGAACLGKLGFAVYLAAAAAILYTVALTVVAARETSTEMPGKVVFLPAAVIWAFFFCGPALLIPALPLRAIPSAAFLAACFEATRAAFPVFHGKLPVPPFIGRLIRIMLTLQAAWILVALASKPVPVLLAVCGSFVVLRVAAEMAGKRFYGS